MVKVELIVVIIALATAALGVVGVASPARLIAFVRSWQSPTGVHTAAALRLLLGIALLVVAADSRTPDLLRVLGVLIIVAGIATALIGVERFRALLDWWAAQSPLVIRAWGGFAVAFGLLLVYAVY
jgi:hypothetical protein